jgi:hypothetical protein
VVSAIQAESVAATGMSLVILQQRNEKAQYDSDPCFMLITQVSFVSVLSKAVCSVLGLK